MPKQPRQTSGIKCRATFYNFTSDEVIEFGQRFSQAENGIVFKSKLTASSNQWEERIERLFDIDADLSSRTLKYGVCVDALVHVQNLFEEVRSEICQDKNGIVRFCVLTKDLYPIKFNLSHLFDVFDVSFGSLDGMYFNQTFKVTAPREDKQNVFKKYINEVHDTEMTSTMMVQMEHDRGSLSVFFPDVFFHRQNQEWFKRIVELNVVYGAIKRVLVKLNSVEDGRVFVEFTFLLNYPVKVQIAKLDFKNGADRKKTVEVFSMFDRFMTWNKACDIESAIAKGNSFHINLAMDSARHFMDCVDRLSRTISFPIEYTCTRLSKDVLFISHYMDPNVIFSGNGKFDNPEGANTLDYFPLRYAVEALLCNGGTLYDYFFRYRSKDFERFVNEVTSKYEQEMCVQNVTASKTCLILEQMLAELDSLVCFPDPWDMFCKLYEQQHASVLEMIESQSKEGYVRIRRIIVTPTRRLYVAPELIMGNRAIQSCEGNVDKMLRVVFRDDNGRKLTGIGMFLIDKIVGNLLLASTWDAKTMEQKFKREASPLMLGGRRFSFLGYSNSQLREHGCYFLEGKEENVIAFRKNSGRFKLEAISKMMSRFAQIFTQSKKSNVLINDDEYRETFDYEGGRDGNNKPYTFSDGNGVISRAFAKKIMADGNLEGCLPTCYQIRFRGYKGILALNSSLDETLGWVQDSYGVLAKDGPKKPEFACSILFRPSQRKFHGPREKYIQVVKMSAPNEVCLNKQLLNVLDQDAEKQGCSERIRKAVFESVERHIHGLMEIQYDEVKASIAIRSFPKFIHYDHLGSTFQLTEEPFLKSLLRTVARADFHNALKKMKIKIPLAEGRMMFGIFDESGLLQPGQVFIQYTVNNDVKYPKLTDRTIVHKGRVLITKNPCVVSGDVRLFQAVDIYSFREDYKDVVVFPQHGPRPHPDEMAGSDLDGDEYSIYFNPGIFLDRNMPPFDFTAAKNEAAVPESEDKAHEQLTPKGAEFFIKYISQDSIGSIANALLANSDLYGLDAPHCFELAKKHNMSVDFPKSGNSPNKLVNKWSEDIPPEIAEIFPDFMGSVHKSSYRSTRLLGHLQSYISTWMDMTENASKIANESSVIHDPDLKLADTPENKAFLAKARKEYHHYSAAINGLMEKHGIGTEAELFTGCFISLKKRANEKDADDMSFFTVKYMIETELAEILSWYRREFFKEFDGFDLCTEPLAEDKAYKAGVKEVFARHCVNPTDKMQKKAQAYYTIAYNNKRFLSFPWLVSDIMIFLKRRAVHDFQNKKVKFVFDPLMEKLSTCIEETVKLPQFSADFERFQKMISAEKCHPKVVKYCKNFGGLVDLMYFMRLWIGKMQLSNIPVDQMDLFLVWHAESRDNWLFELDEGESRINLRTRVGGLGRLFWNVILYFLKREFGHADPFSFEPVFNLSWSKSQCLDVHRTAVENFFTIVFSGSLNSLPGGTGANHGAKIAVEGSIFMIEVPKSEAEEYIQKVKEIAKKCGIEQLRMRKKPTPGSGTKQKLSLQPVGKFCDIQKFKNLLIVEPNMKEPNFRKRFDDLINQLVKKIDFYSRPDVSVDADFFTSSLEHSSVE